MTDVGTRPPRELVDTHRDEIKAIVARHHGRSVAIFGSVARGDERLASDIDFLVELAPDARPFEIPAIWIELEQAPGVSWRKIARMRDHLAHHHFDTDDAIVQDVVDNELDPLPRRGALADRADRPGRRAVLTGPTRDRPGPTGRTRDLALRCALHGPSLGRVRQQLLEHAPHLTCTTAVDITRRNPSDAR